MSRFLLLTGLLMFALSGCGAPDAMDLRKAEFAYTPEKLGQELIDQLKIASANQARSQADSERGADVREREADRGGDGDRPDPNSVEAIALDAIAKIKSIEEMGTADAADKVLGFVMAEPQISDSIKKDFEAQVMSGLASK